MATTADTKRIIRKWKSLLLDRWDLFFEFGDQPRDDDKSGQCTIANCTSDWRYLEHRIAFYTPTIRDISVEDMTGHVIHEMCHALVNEMQWEGLAHEERVCTELKQAFLNVYEEGWKDCIKTAKKGAK